MTADGTSQSSFEDFGGQDMPKPRCAPQPVSQSVNLAGTSNQLQASQAPKTSQAKLMSAIMALKDRESQSKFMPIKEVDKKNEESRADTNA